MTRLPLAFALAVLALLPGAGFALTPDEQLLHAVREGDHSTAAALLSGAVDPNKPLADGSTPLSWAVESQDADMVRLLLEAGARTDGSDNAAASALVVGCQYGNAAVLDLLLQAGANVKAATADGITALALCAGNAPTAVVAALLDAGAAIDKADNKGQTPLMWAAAKGRIDTIKLLIERGANVNSSTQKGLSPLFFALKSGETLAPPTLLDAGADAAHVAADGTTVVQMAIYQKDYGFARRMVEQGADVAAFDLNGNQLLHAAVLANDAALVTAVLAKGADPNMPTGPSTVEWRYERNFKAAAYYVPPKTPLQLAAEKGEADIMQLLVDAGADSSKRSVDGINVVLAAAASGKQAALALALALQPDANVTSANGDTPLHVLINSKGRATTTLPEFTAMLQLLAEKGARIDIANARGRTAAALALDADADVKALFATHFKPVPAPL